MKSFLSIVRSVLAAFLGVQSEKNRQQDFKSGSAWPFIVTGIMLTVLFVILLILLVRWLTQTT
ncbi:DUF2970 domain-containing protein [Oceanospirillum sediminis]|uniref:DUF2970 domain-containing protein n=1 Tax=Oceanospirillum sediminis TaxID=2760088 RepID=A0A839IQV4_9GAMM|nr:DUF2970 domain-containing protein [Oceanospirillum sediminis]MBB1486879.1 DUF2970 domain-containing protein [Oceanospirillum sediminis]